MSVLMTDLLGVLALGLACWVLRVLFVLVVPADRLPPIVAEGLRHLAPAALASLCAVELTGALHGTSAPSAMASVGVVGAAAVVALVTRSMSWTVLAGIAAVLAVDLVLLAG
jgi:branched-subunit amino acid transport protein